MIDPNSCPRSCDLNQLFSLATRPTASRTSASEVPSAIHVMTSTSTRVRPSFAPIVAFTLSSVRSAHRHPPSFAQTKVANQAHTVSLAHLSPHRTSYTPAFVISVADGAAGSSSSPSRATLYPRLASFFACLEAFVPLDSDPVT